MSCFISVSLALKALVKPCATPDDLKWEEGFLRLWAAILLAWLVRDSARSHGQMGSGLLRSPGRPFRRAGGRLCVPVRAISKIKCWNYCSRCRVSGAWADRNSCTILRSMQQETVGPHERTPRVESGRKHASPQKSAATYIPWHLDKLVKEVMVFVMFLDIAVNKIKIFDRLDYTLVRLVLVLIFKPLDKIWLNCGCVLFMLELCLFSAGSQKKSVWNLWENLGKIKFPSLKSWFCVYICILVLFSKHKIIIIWDYFLITFSFLTLGMPTYSLFFYATRIFLTTIPSWNST